LPGCNSARPEEKTEHQYHKDNYYAIGEKIILNHQYHWVEFQLSHVQRFNILDIIKAVVPDVNSYNFAPSVPGVKIDPLTLHISGF